MTEYGLTVAQAATMLGRSPRLIRKLIAEGRIAPIAGTDPMRVTEASVIAERTQRKRKPVAAQAITGTASDGQGIGAEQLEAILTRALTAALEATTQQHTKQLEARDQVEQRLTAALAEAEQRNQQLAQQLAEIQQQLAAPRKWWRGNR